MAGTPILFGKRIIPHHMLNFSEQIYDILVGEIELGRWKVDERLPGVIALARELGFGTKTVQVAYDRLKQEGYARTLGYRGTYLKSVRPGADAPGGAPPGKVGVLISEEQGGDPLILWYQHAILENARRRKLVSEVKVIPRGLGPEEVNRRGALFGEGVVGIVSLTPFRMPVRYGDDADALPLVFLCPPFEQCAPIVCADVREAYYDLTMRLVRLGHRGIVFSEDSVEPDPRQTEMHREGYVEAMAQSGLDVDGDAMAASRKVHNDRLPTVLRHLRALVSGRRGARPTAVVAGSLGRAMTLCRMAPIEGVKIPADFSVVTIGTAHIAGGDGARIAGMLPDFDRMVGFCLETLEEQAAKGVCDITRVSVRMHFVPGATLAAAGAVPGEAALLRGEGADARVERRHLEALSKAVHYPA